MFSAMTFAPTMTVPLWSVTCPEIEPVTVWPNAGDRSIKAASEHPAR